MLPSFMGKSLKRYEVYPLGENALTISFGNEISAENNNLVTLLSNRIEQSPFEGFIESVPAYSSLTIFYDLIKTKRKFPHSLSGFEIVKSLAEIELQKLETESRNTPRRIEIPISFQKKFALDLDHVAKVNQITSEDVIDTFLSGSYRVFMLGFLPGFAYMGEVDERISTPRKKSPRTHVPKGSVGIAGKQTGIYPLESPGGWQIIGRTDVELFTPEDQKPTLFEAGDLVKFIKI